MNKWVSGGELARLKGKTPQWINRKLKDSGVQKRGGKFHCEEALEFLDQNTDVVKNPKFAEDIQDLRIWKLRKETAITKLKEMEVAERAGRLVPVEEARKLFFKIGRQVRDAILAIEHRLPGAVSVNAEQQRMIRDALHREFIKALHVLNDFKL